VREIEAGTVTSSQYDASASSPVRHENRIARKEEIFLGRQNDAFAAGQNLTRAPTWNDRGSPTAVICPNVGSGFVGYAPGPKFVFLVSTLR
jgi:hypothetical protein